MPGSGLDRPGLRIIPCFGRKDVNQTRRILREKVAKDIDQGLDCIVVHFSGWRGRPWEPYGDVSA